MGPEFRVGRLTAVALIGALISEIRFRDRRGGGVGVAAVTQTNLQRHGSPVTGPGTGQTWARDARRRPSLPSSSRGVSSIGLPIVRCPASGAATPDLCGERVSKVRSPPPIGKAAGRRRPQVTACPAHRGETAECHGAGRGHQASVTHQPLT